MGQIKIPRITTAQRTGGSGLTLAAGELVYDTDTGYIYKGDGSTAGGVLIEGGGVSGNTFATDLKIGRDADNLVDFTTDNNVVIRANGEDQLTLVDGALTPSSNAILDLGTDTLEFKDAYFDGTLEADAITIGGTAIASVLSPVAGHASIATVGTIGTGVWQGTAIATAYIADDAVTEAKLANTLLAEIDANTAKNTNVAGNLSATANGTSLTVETSNGSNVALPAATNSAWGIMSDDHVVALEANTAKTSFSNLTGEVTSSGAATTITDNVVDEANLKVSNAPTNGYFLSAQSGDTGGLTWAAASGGGDVVDDTAPQLGGNLDVNGFDIESNGNVTVQIDADNNTSLSKFQIKNGAGNAIYTIDEEGTTLATTGASNNVKIGNLDGGLGTFNGISLNGNLTYPGIVGFAGGSSASNNFFCFGEVIDFRAGGASDSSMRIVETGGEAQVVINKPFVSGVVPTTHTLYVGGNGKFDGNLDAAAGLDVTGDITVTGKISGNGSSVAVGKLETAIATAGAAGEVGLNAEVVTITTTTGLSAGYVYYLGSSAWVGSDADAVATSVGLMAVATSASSATGMVIRGIVYLATDPGGSVGDVVYLSTATGRLTTDISGFTTGDVVRVMGYKIGTNLVFFNPSRDWEIT